jgi:C1A family cysteine protease
MSVPTRIYNLRISPPDQRDFRYIPQADRDILPPTVDLQTEMPPVLNQQTLGSCASTATSNILRHLLRKEHLPEFQPSRLYIYWNTRVNIEGSPAGEDTGVCIRDVCKAVAKYHACDERIWPYKIKQFSQSPPLEAYKNANLHKSFKYNYVPQELTVLKRALADHLPIIFGIQVYESLETEEVMGNGIIPMPNMEIEQCLGGHAIILVGYNDTTRRFKIMNSWGPYVGQRGYFEIDYDYVLSPELSADFWVMSFFS